MLTPRRRGWQGAGHLRSAGRGHPCLHHVDWERKHDGRTALAGDVEECGEVAQLHRLGCWRQDAGGFDQLLCGLLFAFRIDDLRASGTFGLRLARDRAHHALVEVDALDLNIGNLNPPSLGLFVEHVLNIGIELVALAQHLVEIVFTQYPTQRGLGELARRRQVVVDLDDGPLGIDDTKVDDGVYLDRHIVARNHILRRYLVDDDAKVDAHHLLHDREQQEEPRPLGPRITPEREHHTTLI